MSGSGESEERADERVPAYKRTLPTENLLPRRRRQCWSITMFANHRLSTKAFFDSRRMSTRENHPARDGA